MRFLKKIVPHLTNTHSDNNSSKINIIDWEPGYYPDITEANAFQQRCYQQIEAQINKARHVDVGQNDAYLYYYLDKIKTSLLGNPNSAPMVSALIKNFIRLYRADKPKIVNYIYPWHFLVEVLLQHPAVSINEDLMDLDEFRNTNRFYNTDDFLLSIFVTFNKITNDIYVGPEWFRLFAGNLEPHLTKVGKESKQEIMPYIYDLLAADFQEDKTNFIYKMYDFAENGSIEYLTQVALNASSRKNRTVNTYQKHQYLYHQC